MKKSLCACLAAMLLVISACSFGGKQAAETQGSAVVPAEQPQEEEKEPEEQAGDTSESSVKIGIIAGAESSDEINNIIKRVKTKYGSEVDVLTAISEDTEPSPDDLASIALTLAEEGCEAIVFNRAAAGTANAISKLREAHPYVLVICGTADEEPELISTKADIVMNIDDDAYGATIIEQAKKLGAKTFILYTFPRHMADRALSNLRDSFGQACSELGLAFVDATSPDPEIQGGLNDAIGFLYDDIPRMVERYGAETAFFSTADDLQETLIRIALQEGARFPQLCHPSPFHGYPEALNIEFDGDNKGNFEYAIEQIGKEIKERGGHGRFSTWPVTFDAFVSEAGIEYSIAFLRGSITERNDYGTLKAVCSEIAGGNGKAAIKKYTAPDGGAIDNFYLLLLDYVVF